MVAETTQPQKVHVCHISTVHDLSDVRVFYRECCSLVTAGYEVHLIIPCEQSCVKKGVHIHCIRRVKSRLLRMLFMPWVAMRKALRTKASLYHYHDPELVFMGFVLRWFFGKRVIFDIHESVARQIMGKGYLPRFTRKAVSLSYRFLEHISIRGQVLILANENSLPDYSSNVYLVRNYPLLNEDLIASAVDEKQTSKIPLLVYVGGVTKVRGALVYIELAAKLAAKHHEFRMLLIGPCSKELHEELNARIKRFNLTDMVFVTGHMDYPKAMHCVARATIGMCLLLPLPNYTTCLATKVIEYMMLGTPVLASDFDVWRPYVEGERTGMLADPTNVDEVLEVCEKMLADRDQLAAMGRQGMIAVRDKYNWSSEFGVLLECYQDLLSK